MQISAHLHSITPAQTCSTFTQLTVVVKATQQAFVCITTRSQFFKWFKSIKNISSPQRLWIQQYMFAPETDSEEE